MSTKELANYMEENGSGHWPKNKDEIIYDVSSLDSSNQDIVEKAFDRWDEILEKDFKKKPNGSQDIDEDINIKSWELSDSGGLAYPDVNDSNEITSAHITYDSSLLDNADQTFYFDSLLHEIGHTIGLTHPGDYNGEATFADNAKFPDDSYQKTVMSYFDQSENPNTEADQATPITPQIADFVAVKNMYDLESDTRDGDTTYGYGSEKAEFSDPNEWHGNNASLTIYDAGGTDTIDMSEASSNQKIDLRAGHFSNYGGESDVIGTDTLKQNMTIAPGVTIENADGGKGDDTLIGNDANNDLNGGAGNDRLTGVDPSSGKFAGYGENDTLTGGFGADTFVLGDSDTAYYSYSGYYDYSATDYAIIKDFNSWEDTIQLHGNADNYSVDSSGGDWFFGSDTILKYQGEQIATLEGVSSFFFDLSDNAEFV